MSQLLTMHDFAEHLRTTFLLEHPAGHVALELVAVDSLPSGAGRDDCFTLLFRAPGRKHLPQATYHLRHHRLGALDIFLVPVRRDAEALYYEAVFNQATLPG